MLQAGHYDPEAIRNCAEKVAIHWQQLMLKMEDRLKLVNASVAFYKTSEQVPNETTRALRLRVVPISVNVEFWASPFWPGVQRVGEPGAGVPPRRGLVRQSRQAGNVLRQRPPSTSDQQTPGAERSLPQGPFASFVCPSKRAQGNNTRHSRLFTKCARARLNSKT